MVFSRKLIAATLAIAGIAALAGCAKSGAKGGDKVRVILDWTPNTNHTGLYVALDQGYYAKEGLDVEILPFSSSGVEPVLSSGGADFGISGSEALTFARASGQKLKSVFIIQQKPSLQLGVAANRDDIQSPKDLDGKIYAGFGLPFEQPIVRTVIKAAGGKGVFDAVSLSTSAYEAVYSKKADFALPPDDMGRHRGQAEGHAAQVFRPHRVRRAPELPAPPRGPRRLPREERGSGEKVPKGDAEGLQVRCRPPEGGRPPYSSSRTRAPTSTPSS